jgi:hypothetical protein
MSFKKKKSQTFLDRFVLFIMSEKDEHSPQITLANTALKHNLEGSFFQAGLNEMVTTMGNIFGGGKGKESAAIIITQAMDDDENTVIEKRKPE